MIYSLILILAFIALTFIGLIFTFLISNLIFLLLYLLFFFSIFHHLRIIYINFDIDESNFLQSWYNLIQRVKLFHTQRPHCIGVKFFFKNTASDRDSPFFFKQSMQFSKWMRLIRKQAKSPIRDNHISFLLTGERIDIRNLKF